MKKGISPIVAVVLLIAIAILAAVALFFWTAGVATKQPVPNTPVSLTVVPLGGGKLLVANLGTVMFPGSNLTTSDPGVTVSCPDIPAGEQVACDISGTPSSSSFVVYGTGSGAVQVESGPAFGNNWAHCTNGVKDEDEIAADCGGTQCSLCQAGSSCTRNSDCSSTYCGDGVCGAVPTNVSGCMTISSAGTYRLTADIIAGGTCITVASGGSNSIVDCQGHTITGPGNYGIILDQPTNVTVKNCKVTGFTTGFYFNYANGNTLQNSQLYSNTGHGTYLFGSSSNKLTGNTITLNNKGAGLIYHANGNNLTGNTIASNTNRGIDTDTFIIGNIYTNNNVSNNGASGIYISGTDGPSTFTGNTVKNNALYDFECVDTATDGGGNVYDKGDGCSWLRCQPTINACCSLFTAGTHVLGRNINTTGNCIVAYAGGSNSVVDCNGYTISGPGNYGVLFDQSTNVTVKNCKITGFSNGVHISFASGNTLQNNQIYSNTGYGTYLVAASSNKLIGNTLSSNSHGAGVIYHSNSNNFTGNTIVSNTNRGINTDTFLMWNTYTGNNVSSNGASGIYISGTDGLSTFTANTVKNNALYDFECADVATDGGGNVYDKSDSCSWMDCQPTINACCSLLTPGSRVLGRNINATGTCISAYASGSNSVVDCNGYTISGPGSYGVYFDQCSNVTVRNCNITGFGTGAHFSFASGNKLQNSKLYSNTGYGVYLFAASSNTLTGNTVTLNGNGAGVIYHSNSNNFTGNTIVSNTNRGINTDTFLMWNTYTSNNVSSNGGSGIYVSGTDGVRTFTGNTVKSNGVFDFECVDTATDGGGNVCDNADGCSPSPPNWLTCH